MSSVTVDPIRETTNVVRLVYLVVSKRRFTIEEDHVNIKEAKIARVFRFKLTGQSRGLGFVEMWLTSEAEAAIESLDATQFEGRSLTVNEDKPIAKRNNFDGGGDGGRDRW